MLDGYQGPVPVYLLLATVLRGQILDGTLPAGALVPGEGALAETYGVSRQTARMAVGVLREGGWVVTRRGHGSVVLPAQVREVTVHPGAAVGARLALPTDGPVGSEVVLLVTQPGGPVEAYPAGRTVVRAS